MEKLTDIKRDETDREVCGKCFFVGHNKNFCTFEKDFKLWFMQCKAPKLYKKDELP